MEYNEIGWQQYDFSVFYKINSILTVRFQIYAAQPTISQNELQDKLCTSIEPDKT